MRFAYFRIFLHFFRIFFKGGLCNPPTQNRRRNPNKSAEQIGGPIFQQNRFPVPWILVRGSKHLPFGCSVVGVMWKPKLSLNSQKKILLSVCTWSLRTCMSVSASGPVVYALV